MAKKKTKRRTQGARAEAAIFADFPNVLTCSGFIATEAQGSRCHKLAAGWMLQISWSDCADRHIVAVDALEHASLRQKRAHAVPSTSPSLAACSTVGEILVAGGDLHLDGKHVQLKPQPLISAAGGGGPFPVQQRREQVGNRLRRRVEPVQLVHNLRAELIRGQKSLRDRRLPLGGDYREPTIDFSHRARPAKQRDVRRLHVGTSAP